MADSDLRSVIAKNITDQRKSMGLTQAELALQLNYTDKAISKWERAESMPDVTVLKGMADLYNVPINYLLETEHSQSERAVKAASRHRTRNRIIIALLSAACVYFLVFIYPVLYVWCHACFVSFVCLFVCSSFHACVWLRVSVCSVFSHVAPTSRCLNRSCHMRLQRSPHSQGVHPALMPIR
jgi:transcriptional regulator with XRE-family HTH domain